MKGSAIVLAIAAVLAAGKNACRAATLVSDKPVAIQTGARGAIAALIDLKPIRRDDMSQLTADLVGENPRDRVYARFQLAIIDNDHDRNFDQVQFTRVGREVRILPLKDSWLSPGQPEKRVSVSRYRLGDDTRPRIVSVLSSALTEVYAHIEDGNIGLAQLALDKLFDAEDRKPK